MRNNRIKSRAIFCCGCLALVQAILTDGKEIYPHRKDLHARPFWRCPTCDNYVGCHYKTPAPTTPLGNIPTRELRDARGHIHRILDPLWKGKSGKRGKIYARISAALGYQYHTAEIKMLEEARKVFVVIRRIAREIEHARSGQPIQREHTAP